MSRYIAKKVTLDITRECCNRECGCYSWRGYLITCTNSNADGAFFVCEECYDKKYRFRSDRQDVAAAPVTPRYRRQVERDRPAVRRIIRTFNRSIRAIKYASLCLFIATAILVGISSEERRLRKIEVVIPTISVPFEDTLSEKLSELDEWIQYVLTGERGVS